MEFSLEELSDFWQDVLYVRCKGDVNKARDELLRQYSLYPHSSMGRFSGQTLKLLSKTGVLKRAIYPGNMSWR